MKFQSVSKPDAAGHSWVSNLLWFLAAIAMIFACLRLINPKLREYAIEKKVEDIGRFDGLHMKAEQIQQVIFDYAQTEKIPLKLEDIEVRKVSSTVIVHIKYEETIDLIVVKWPYKVDMEKSSTNY